MFCSENVRPTTNDLPNIDSESRRVGSDGIISLGRSNPISTGSNLVTAGMSGLSICMFIAENRALCAKSFFESLSWLRIPSRPIRQRSKAKQMGKKSTRTSFASCFFFCFRVWAQLKHQIQPCFFSFLKRSKFWVKRGQVRRRERGLYVFHCCSAVLYIYLAEIIGSFQEKKYQNILL